MKKHMKSVYDNVKETYLAKWPDDDTAKKYLRSDLTFLDVFRYMAFGQDFYDLIGIADSLIRERIFTEMAVRGCGNFVQLHNFWINSTRRD